jgi:TnpA family transposase
MNRSVRAALWEALRNDAVKSDVHSTDTHGYSEIDFAATHLPGFEFAPWIKSVNRQQIYAVKKRALRGTGDRAFDDLPLLR